LDEQLCQLWRGQELRAHRVPSELPAAVLADLLAIDIVTATRWAQYAKRG
jgi:hypothetical protein